MVKLVEVEVVMTIVLEMTIIVTTTIVVFIISLLLIYLIYPVVWLTVGAPL